MKWSLRLRSSLAKKWSWRSKTRVALLLLLATASCYLGDARVPRGPGVSHGDAIDVFGQIQLALSDGGYMCKSFAGTGGIREHMECERTAKDLPKFIVLLRQDPLTHQLSFVSRFPWKVPDQCEQRWRDINEEVNELRPLTFAWCSSTDLVFSSALLIPDRGLDADEVVRWVRQWQTQVAIAVRRPKLSAYLRMGYP
jgi:hypothetical protein